MIGRLRDWLGRLLGRGGGGSAGADGDDDPTATAADAAAETTGYECAVCGTAVEGPEASCPLCSAGDVVPVDGEHDGGQEGATADAEPAEVRETDAGPAEVREADATDDAAAQLRELREEQNDGE